MAATLNRDRDTASGVTDAPNYIRQRQEMYEDRGWRPPGNDHYAKSGWEVSTWGRWRERHWSSGNDEETEDGSTMCIGDEVER